MDVHLTTLLPVALLVDLPEIDAQHEEIFSQIECLRAVSFENGYVAMEDFESLIDLFERHFATEERMADEAGIDFTAHADLHRNTLRLLRKALSEVLHGGQDEHSFLRYVEYWFERHISEDDRAFVAKLTASSCRRSTKRRRGAGRSQPAPV